MEQESLPAARPTAGRPRDARLDQAILDATSKLVLDKGYTGFSVQDVADSAGTTKAAIYRRWSTKAVLVHAAAFASVPSDLPPSSRDVTGEVRALVRVSRELFSDPVTRAALPHLLAEVAGNRDVNTRALTRFREQVFPALTARLHALGVDGEVRTGVNAERVAELVGGAALLRLMIDPDLPLDDEWVEQTTDILVAGIATPTTKGSR